MMTSMTCRIWWGISTAKGLLGHSARRRGSWLRGARGSWFPMTLVRLRAGLTPCSTGPTCFKGTVSFPWGEWAVDQEPSWKKLWRILVGRETKFPSVSFVLGSGWKIADARRKLVQWTCWHHQLTPSMGLFCTRNCRKKNNKYKKNLSRIDVVAYWPILDLKLF